MPVFINRNHPVHIRERRFQIRLVPLGKAAHDNHPVQFSAFMGKHFFNGVQGLFLGRGNKAAGIDDAGIGIFPGGGKLLPAFAQNAEQILGIDQVFGTAKGNDSYLHTVLQSKRTAKKTAGDPLRPLLLRHQSANVPNGSQGASTTAF